jgi:hypothetical protein
MSAFASAMTTSYALHCRTTPFDATIRKPWETFDCAQVVREQSLRSRYRPLMRANVTPLTARSRAESVTVTVPQPSSGETRMFFDAVPRPTFFSTDSDPAPPPNPGRVPGAMRTCTPPSISASDTEAIASPIASQSQATSITVPKVASGLGVSAGQCEPSGPYAPVDAPQVTPPPSCCVDPDPPPDVWPLSHRINHSIGLDGSVDPDGVSIAGTATAAAVSSARREIGAVMRILRRSASGSDAHPTFGRGSVGRSPDDPGAMLPPYRQIVKSAFRARDERITARTPSALEAQRRDRPDLRGKRRRNGLRLA